MSDALYSLAVLRLASEANAAGRLNNPDVTFTEHNPACGDRATIDLRLESGRIVEVAQHTKACVLAQASASILGEALRGHSREDIVGLRAAVAAMLQAGPPPAEPFARYAALKDAAGHPGRHRCVLLPIDAALKAFESDPGEPSRQGPKG